MGSIEARKKRKEEREIIYHPNMNIGRSPGPEKGAQDGRPAPTALAGCMPSAHQPLTCCHTFNIFPEFRLD